MAKKTEKTATPAEKTQPSVADELRLAIADLSARVASLEDLAEGLASPKMQEALEAFAATCDKADERIAAVEAWKASIEQTRAESQQHFEELVSAPVATPTLGAVVRYVVAGGEEKPAKIKGLSTISTKDGFKNVATLKVFSDDGPETHTNVEFSAEPKPGCWSL